MTGRERFLNALNLEAVDRTPVWFMRQAGRYLPEYRKLKERYHFRQMVQTPELATEVTLQPLQRFSTIDAAILFSDILIIPEALGMNYEFRERGGIEMEWQFSGTSDLKRLSASSVEDRLGYVFRALDQIGGELNGKKALLGFGGSPWTLATYMVEGGSSKDFERIKAMGFTDPDLLNRLLEMITEALIILFREMAKCGVDAIQIFDSWGSACPGDRYEDWSLHWIRRIIDSLKDEVPVILFSKGMGAYHEKWADAGARVFSLDSSLDLRHFASLPNRSFALQGNLDPVLLTTTPEIVKQATRKILGQNGPIRGHIFNLGHGIQPHARIECVESMLDAVEETGSPR